MKLYHIVAVSENLVIGKDGGIPWRIKGDLPRFKEITKGHAVIMGRKTAESLPKQYLPYRYNVILTREVVRDGEPVPYPDSGIIESGNDEVVCARSIEEALAHLNGKYQEVYIIGGGEIYAQTLDMVDEVRMTEVHQEVEVDDSCVFYPELGREWIPSFSEEHSTHTYSDYVRNIYE